MNVENVENRVRKVQLVHKAQQDLLEFKDLQDYLVFQEFPAQMEQME